MVPKNIFFTKGVGKHKERLTSFELALRDAGIASQNLVRVSSIFPPQCKVITRKEGLKYLSHGEVVFAVIAENSTREAHRLVVSSIGVAIPADRNTYGYLSEHHSFGETEDQAGEYAEELAAEMLATTLDVDFDPDKKKILPCAAFLQGEYGIEGYYIGVPCKLGAAGLEQIIEIKLTPEEDAALKKSAEAVKELCAVISV